jgi:hypothetical protein
MQGDANIYGERGVAGGATRMDEPICKGAVSSFINRTRQEKVLQHFPIVNDFNDLYLVLRSPHLTNSEIIN